MGQGTEICRAVLAAGRLGGPADRLPPRLVDSRRIARELDFPPHGEPGPEGMDDGGGALHHVVRDRPDLRAAVPGCRAHSGLAPGSTYDGAATAGLAHPLRDAVLQLAATSVYLLVRSGKTSFDRYRGRVPRGVGGGSAAALPDDQGWERVC